MYSGYFGSCLEIDLLRLWLSDPTSELKLEMRL